MVAMQQQVSESQMYGRLCERRILELSPGHPMPVAPHHLGMPGSSGIRAPRVSGGATAARLAQVEAELAEAKAFAQADATAAAQKELLAVLASGQRWLLTLDDIWQQPHESSLSGAVHCTR